jgi:replicative DNA helicase
MLSDLRESGSIEQDADIVMFIHRPEYYERKEEVINENNWKNLAQIIIGKHRNGATGEVDLTFLRDFGRFDNREFTAEEPVMPHRNSHNNINEIENDVAF